MTEFKWNDITFFDIKRCPETGIEVFTEETKYLDPDNQKEHQEALNDFSYILRKHLKFDKREKPVSEFEIPDMRESVWMKK